jgi:predicted phage tail component-like protein
MLSIDGVHLENDLGLHLLAGSDETMMPETRQDTLTIPDRHGAIAFDSYLEPRRLFPQILIPSQATLNDVQGIVRKVSSLLVDEYGKPKDVKVIYDYEPDKYYIARLTGYISVDRIAKAGIFLIPLYAYDPFAYSSEERLITGLSNIARSTDNEGSVITKPIIELSSLPGQIQSIDMASEEEGNDLGNLPLLNPVVNINGNEIRYSGELSGTVIIDSKEMVAKEGSINSLMKISGDFPVLHTGNNTVSVTDDNGAIGNIKIMYRERWV